MFNIGSQEVLVILLLVFVLFGPRHIPDVAHALGKGLGDLRRALQGIEDAGRRFEGETPRAGDAVPVPRTPSLLPPGLGGAGDREAPSPGREEEIQAAGPPSARPDSDSGEHA